MAHGITDRDGLFVTREPAWHGLGVVLPDHPTREEAQRIAHPWEPVTEPVYRAVPNLTHTRPEFGMCRSVDNSLCTIESHWSPSTVYEQVEGFQAVVRSDTTETLGVVSDTYEPVRNAEMYDIAEAIEGEAKGSVRFETGGSLKGGRKVWLLIRLNEPLVLNGDDRTAVIPYYGLQNAHDGSGSFRGQATMTMIVCDNTAQMADLDSRARGTEFVFRHTVNVKDRIAEAQQALAGWRNGVQEYRLMAEHLLDVRVSMEQQAEFIERFIPLPPPHVASKRVLDNVLQARMKMEDIIDSPTQEGVGGSAYGLVQASVEYLNHARKARSQETRFKRSYLDRDQIVTDAVALVKEVAHA